jgi:hypothetical protein
MVTVILVTALGATAWLVVVLLCIGLAQAAARGDVAVSRALAAESRRRATEAQARRQVRRAA